MGTRGQRCRSGGCRQGDVGRTRGRTRLPTSAGQVNTALSLTAGGGKGSQPGDHPPTSGVCRRRDGGRRGGGVACSWWGGVEITRQPHPGPAVYGQRGTDTRTHGHGEFNRPGGRGGAGLSPCCTPVGGALSGWPSPGLGAGGGRGGGAVLTEVQEMLPGERRRRELAEVLDVGGHPGQGRPLPQASQQPHGRPAPPGPAPAPPPLTPRP